jgi:hypothetical protein
MIRMKISENFIIAGVIVVSLVVYNFLFKKDYISQLGRKKTEMSVAKVIRRYTMHRSPGVRIEYSYSYKGNEMSKIRVIDDVIYNPELFVNKFFPVVLSVDDPGESVILLTPKDFRYFNREFPDSLNWVLELVHDE